ncbi:MAG: amino acid adenylation domain-containing protein, partial [Defluviitaleaceae bacterium]|nr:amino acid adenylation domain-containing protein [Defluviitaleaceae bacterium]
MKNSEQFKIEASYFQKSIWFVNELENNSNLFNVRMGYHLKGKLDVNAFKNSIEYLVNRHESLRTTFDMINGTLYQIITNEINYNLTEINAESYELNDKDKINKSLEDISKKTFDLVNGPLLDITIINLGKNQIVCLLLHHIITDGWSTGIIFNELESIYKSYRLNSSVLLPNMEFQYVDYTAWHNSLIKTDEYKNKLNFWFEYLLDSPVESALSIDVKRPMTKSTYGESFKYIIEKTGHKKVLDFCKEQNITLFMFFQIIIFILQNKYTGQEDFIIGSPVATRNQEGLENVVGYLVNTLPFRLKMNSDISLKDAINIVRNDTLEALDHRDVPFEQIVKKVNLIRDISMTPLFQTFLSVATRENKVTKFYDLECEEIAFEDYYAEYDISFTFVNVNGSFETIINYNTDLYSIDTIKKYASNINTIIDYLCSNIDMKMNEITVLTKREQHLILEEFNDTITEYPRDKTVVQLFEEQVEKTPENVAIVFEDEQLTYQELNERANMLAHKLRGLGVGPDEYVAIISERSIEMIVGIYGIIKAGGAYVPIASTNPVDRIQYILEDCSSKAVLTYQVEVETSIPVIALEEVGVCGGITENPAYVNKAEDLLYCIYTSGTTGKPKGVMCEHRGLINRIIWMQNRYPLNEHDVILQKTTYTFDVSVWEILWWSFVGGKVVMLKPEGEKDPNEIIQAIEKNGVTTMHFVPSMLKVFSSWLKGKYSNNLKTLKYVFASGEALIPGHVYEFNEAIRKQNEKVSLINVYGPTEASIDVTYFDCGDNDHIIPIGRPISNIQIYIINQMKLCGIGIPGELCIAGDGLARGYLNQPELTAEKFVDNPYGEGKLYRTGDLARWLPDGNIEYLGRIDEQVKIRGFRVELGEIESAIREMEEIKNCAVIAREDSSGEKAIHAYLASDQEVSVSFVRERLTKSLPEYMIPGYMTQIESIPLTRNGKLDKRALPAIEAKVETEYVVPRNEVEENLGGIFEEILGVSRVGVKDSFFELGGHSLRATRLINQIESEIGVRIALKKVFINPTIEALAELVAKSESTQSLPIPKAEEKDYYKMSSAQKRIYFIQEMDLEAVTYNMPQYLKLTGEVRLEGIKRALQELVDRHEILRTAFMMLDGEPVQWVQERVELDFEYVNEVQVDEDQVMLDFVESFDLGKASQLRAKMIHMGSYQLLMIDMHHIISDGMSMGIFIKEFTDLYNGKSLEKLTHQFKDYSDWMRSRDLSYQEAYWLEEFSNEIPMLDLPLDYVRPKERNFEGAITRIETGKELGSKVKEIAMQTGSTEYMVFLASAMVLLGTYANQEDVVIGSPISGRTHKDTEHMLGMFVNTLAMRGQPEKEKSFECL